MYSYTYNTDSYLYKGCQSCIHIVRKDGGHTLWGQCWVTNQPWHPPYFSNTICMMQKVPKGETAHSAIKLCFQILNFKVA